MHELSVALEICRMAQDRLGVARLPSVVAVGVRVGEEAGIEVANLRFCLDALLAEPPFAGARPHLEVRPGADLHLDYLEVEDAGPDH
ncbi:MAG TPA: hydrogenase maturation nickel metallochaperone HypA [Gemmatimonadales bacterium]|nr:hydrogenase maturation nickel metallochaperone HypA [Gemmatimonadales bacterium]